MKHAIFNCKYLDANDCITWSKRPYWSTAEAILLSMGIHPNQGGKIATTDEEAKKLGSEYKDRQDIVSRARKIKQLENSLVSEEDGTGTEEIVYLPMVFSEWAIKTLPSFPQGLYDAVTNFVKEGKNDTPKTNEGSSSQLVEVTDVSKIHLLNSLQLNGIDTELIIPEISADDLKRLFDLIKPPVEPDPVHLANKNKGIRQRKVKATNFMLQQIKANCICNHSKLAGVALKHDNDWNITPDKKLSHDQLKALSMLIVPPERRHNSNQHTIDPIYKPSECNCQQPNHS